MKNEEFEEYVKSFNLSPASEERLRRGLAIIQAQHETKMRELGKYTEAVDNYSAASQEWKIAKRAFPIAILAILSLVFLIDTFAR